MGTNAPDGEPAVVLAAHAGESNIYGVCAYGAAGGGTVFAMSPDYRATPLHAFDRNTAPSDGGWPLVLLAAKDGNFYGITDEPTQLLPSLVSGTFFRLTPDGHFATLVEFGDTIAGQFALPGGFSPRYPADLTSLVEGSDGTMYGTTDFIETIYQISAATAWVPQVVIEFPPNGPDGNHPILMTADDSGNVYGVTTSTNAAHSGGVFRVALGGAFSLIKAGFFPKQLAFDASQGVLRGITRTGGVNDTGEIFTLDSDGTLTATYDFGPDAPTNLVGVEPTKLFTPSDGHVYGVTSVGSQAAISIFQIQADGIPLSLAINAPFPVASLAVDSSGRLVGVSSDYPSPYFTLEAKPTAITLGVTNIGITNAVFRGRVNPGSLPTQVWFDYGTGTNNYSFYQTTAQSVSMTTNGMEFTAGVYLPLYSLAPAPWYFRAHASNRAGEVMGEFMGFTQAVPRPEIQSMRQTNGVTTLSWSTIRGLIYQLQSATNIVSLDWSNVTSAAQALQGTVTAVDTNAAGGVRYYRIAETYP